MFSKITDLTVGRLRSRRPIHPTSDVIFSDISKWVYLDSWSDSDLTGDYNNYIGFYICYNKLI